MMNTKSRSLFGRGRQLKSELRTVQTQRQQEAAGKLPRTQELIEVVDARHNCLIRRDGSVVGAVGFSSIDDTLLTDDDIALKYALYYEMLLTLRFDLQFLIATRPQNLGRYYEDVMAQLDIHRTSMHMIDSFADRLGDYVLAGRADERAFERHFGWHPNALIGAPGLAHQIARRLCDAQYVSAILLGTDDTREKLIDELARGVRTSVLWLARWCDILSEQLDTVRQSVLRAQAPVRLFYFVSSHNPRVKIKTGILPSTPLTDEEFKTANERITERCRMIVDHLESMGLVAWRASHEDLLLDVRSFFNPNQGMLASRRERMRHAAEQ